MKTIFTVIGARPQFVKAAVFSRYIRRCGEAHGLCEYLVHTGQHYDENMSEIFFRGMGIPSPNINLDVGSGGHGKTTGEMLSKLEALLLERKPDIVLVYGDTNSTLAGALAASKLHIPVAHVEAGLRSYMMVMPEEQNRRLADQLSAWLFCPTETAIKNLALEGIRDTAGLRAATSDHRHVSLVGDLMLEASLYYRTRIMELDVHRTYGLASDFILLTIHRAENTDDFLRLKNIIAAITAIKDREFIFPIHPRTRKILANSDIALGSNIKLIDPVGYLEMIALESACSLVVTDSGGVQKEAFFFKKPCITLRDATEWVELVSSGWNRLAGADTKTIIDAIRQVKIPDIYPALYGDGKCAEKIALHLAPEVAQ